MRENERLIAALEKTVEICPEVELAKFIRYISAVEDLAYMFDGDLAVQIECHNAISEDLFDYQAEVNEANYLDALGSCTFYDFTQENEQTAYDRYKAYAKNRAFFELTEKVNMKTFLERFSLEYVDADDYKDIIVINHKDTFLNIFPNAYRHMNGYVAARKGDKYIAKHVYLVKISCFGELLAYAMNECKKEYDECLVITIDWCESPRFTNYTRHIMYGMEYRSKEKVLEIYNDHRTIEKFHEFFWKANKIISDWDGVIFDDGTCDLE